MFVVDGLTTRKREGESGTRGIDAAARVRQREFLTINEDCETVLVDVAGGIVERDRLIKDEGERLPGRIKGKRAGCIAQELRCGAVNGGE